ncbi:MAG: hypothetical protein KJ712_06590 [Bacteroidetes bacterium]|nr:hypothetical protein [Bacteroidota bacterium]MBU1485281.1 hypothetical protein [Bacteroidota bacterium]MBU2046379.1 hypothetical protein [Bacteroidota bacterium]MBU2267757.1 hypothetical protein [Bacteroidota bacterium]MBU2374985.1 hypothetical protein [Bacteroidota bacterium]
MKTLIYSICISILLSSCCSNQKLIFNLYNSEHSTKEKPNGKYFKDLLEIYIVKNYSNCKFSDQQIDSFINSLRENRIKSYDYITIYLYKYSKKTNLENWKNNPQDIDKYSNEHDLIFCYVIHDNAEKSISKSKYRNGKIIEPKGHIEIIDAPQK